MTVYLIHDCLPDSWLFTWFMNVYLIHECLSDSWLFTWFMTVYLIHDYLPDSWMFTWFMTVYQIHDCLPDSWLFTRFMTVYLIHDCIPDSWLFQRVGIASFPSGWRIFGFVLLKDKWYKTFLNAFIIRSNKNIQKMMIYLYVYNQCIFYMYVS